ncbi:MAG TPA: hypothetical protein VE378_07105 [Nitrososphaeraceae archaeon]|nr:hypothetical protein [Nitrososphaeraceae archaeon]
MGRQTGQTRDYLPIHRLTCVISGYTQGPGGQPLASRADIRSGNMWEEGSDRH